MDVPYFLRPDYPKPEKTEFSKAVQRYKDRFGADDLMTESLQFSHEEWIKILDDCVKTNTKLLDYLGIELEPDTDY